MVKLQNVDSLSLYFSLFCILALFIFKEKLSSCCICKEKDVGLDHLAGHSKQILAEMGIIEHTPKGHKASQVGFTMWN